MNDLRVSPAQAAGRLSGAAIARKDVIAEVQRLVDAAAHFGHSVWPVIDRMLASISLPPLARGEIDRGGARGLILEALLRSTKMPGLIPPAMAAATRYLGPGGDDAPLHALVLHRPELDFAVSSPRDFLLGPPISANCFPLRDATAYIADYATRELQFVVCPRDTLRLTDPFFYMAQRQAAVSVTRVKFDLLHRLYPPADPSTLRPLIVLSMGRCGSTLLGRMLGCNGSATISESDIFSQTPGLGGHIAASLRRSREQAAQDAIGVLRTAVQSFAAQAQCPSDRLVLKMRTHANIAARRIAEAFPNARFVFLFREIEAWVRSFVAAFRVPAEGLVDILRNAILACEHLHRRGVSLAILSYEDIVRDPEAALRRIWGTQVPLPPDLTAAIAAIIASDSQESTSLSRSALKRQDPALAALKQQTLDAFRTKWQSARPADSIATLKLPY